LPTCRAFCFVWNGAQAGNSEKVLRPPIKCHTYSVSKWQRVPVCRTRASRRAVGKLRELISRRSPALTLAKHARIRLIIPVEDNIHRSLVTPKQIKRPKNRPITSNTNEVVQAKSTNEPTAPERRHRCGEVYRTRSSIRGSLATLIYRHRYVLMHLHIGKLGYLCCKAKNVKKGHPKNRAFS
jgi:hypothetical protein